MRRPHALVAHVGQAGRPHHAAPRRGRSLRRVRVEVVREAGAAAPTAEARGYPTAEATYQAALYSFFIIAIGGLGCVCCAVLAQRWGRIAVCALCSAASGACCLLVGPASNPASAATLAPTVALLLFWGFVVLPDSPQYTTLVIELVEPSVVGTALVLQQALGYLVTIPTIFIMPLLADDAAFGWQRAYSVLAPGARARRVRAARHLPKMQPS